MGSGWTGCMGGEGRGVGGTYCYASVNTSAVYVYLIIGGKDLAGGDFTVDIATRVVGPDEDIYIMQPGEGYWLYEHYDRFGRVFLDFPGLELDFEAVEPIDATFRQMIVRSVAISKWIDSNKIGREPSRDLSDYLGQDFGLRLGRYVGAARKLYFELLPGTIIVVPGKHYYDDVLIGELVGKPEMFSRKKLYYGESVPARKVKWLRRKPRSAFRMEIRDKFGTPNPIMQLDRSLRGDKLKRDMINFLTTGSLQRG